MAVSLKTKNMKKQKIYISTSKEIASQSLAMTLGFYVIAYNVLIRHCEERSNLFNNQLSAIR